MINTLDELLENHKGCKFPPYPQNFQIPDSIKKKWIKMRDHHKGNNSFYILNMEKEFEPAVGDRFNTVVISSRKKTAKKTFHRTYQLSGIDPILIGYIVDDLDDYEKALLDDAEFLRRIRSSAINDENSYKKSSYGDQGKNDEEYSPKTDPSYMGVKALWDKILHKGQELRKDIVVRVEVINVVPRRRKFYCVALRGTFKNKEELRDNMGNCNYKRAS